jgi:rod shape-determining protein MreD
MSSLLKNIIRFILFILVQAFVLDKIPPLHQFIKPYLYFLFILWLPFNVSRSFLLIIAFAFGMAMDYFSGTPGLHAAPCLLIAFLRPFLISILLPQDTTEASYAEPSFKSMGPAPYSVYVIILTFVHHAFLVLIEWMSFGNFLFFIGKVAGSTAISLLLIFITEMIFSRKAKYRTNAA